MEIKFNEQLVNLSNENYFHFSNGLWTGKKAPFITSKVIRNTNFTPYGNIDTSDIAELRVEQKHFSLRKLIDGDIIIERSGGGPKQPVGRVVYFTQIGDDNFSFSNFTSLIRSKKPDFIKPKFLFYTLLNFYFNGDIQRFQAQTTGLRNLDFNKYQQSVEVALLCQKEQDEIVSILDLIQSAIQKQRQLIDTATELKNALMKTFFTEESRNQQTKEIQTGFLSKTWEIVKLGDISQLITKGSSPNWQGFNYQEQGLLFIRSQNIGWGLIENEFVYLPYEFNKIQSRSILKENDLLINLVGASIGRIAVAPKTFEGANSNQAVALVRLKPKINARFLMYFFLTKEGQFMIKRQRKDIARANISLTDISNFLVPLPNYDEQNDIVIKLDLVQKKIEYHHIKRQTLHSLFSTMLHQLITGKIRVNTALMKTVQNELETVNEPV